MIFQIDCHLFLILDCVFYFKVLCWHAYFFFFFFKSGCPTVKLLKFYFLQKMNMFLDTLLNFCSNLFCQSNRVFMTDRDAANREEMMKSCQTGIL